MDRSTPAPLSDRAVHIAWEFSIISSVLLAMATLLFITRMWTRCFPVYRMLADDYACAVAWVLVVINTSLFYKSLEWILPTWKGDRSKFTLGDLERSSFYAIIAQPFWAWCMASIKISIGLMLLRLEYNKHWRRFLWAMIAFQAVLSTYSTLSQMLGCMPLRDTWDLSMNVPGKCWPSHVQSSSQITIQAFVILTDWIFALLPISFLRKVQRPLRERVIIGFLMGLGVFAGVASIIKIKQIMVIMHSGDPYADIIVVEMWCSIEALTGFIASCVPCLRGPVQRTLERFGVVTQRQTTTYTYGQYPGTRYETQITTGNTLCAHDSPIHLKRGSSSGGDSLEQIISGNDTASTVKNGEIWRTTEVLMEEEQRMKSSHADHGMTPGMSFWSSLTTSQRLSRG